MADVEFDREDGIALVTLNRPKALNAISREMWRRLIEIWDEIRSDEAIRAVVVSGNGDRAFCSGLDLKEWSQLGDPRVRDFWEASGPRDLGRGSQIWKPMIAAVHGYCLAGGFEIALACDIRVASEDATFGFPEIKRGFFPGTGGTVRLSRMMPLGLAFEMLYTGRTISAEEALRFGLINRIVQRGDLFSEVKQLAQMIANGPPLALQAVKEVVLRSLDLPFAEAIRLEAGLRALIGHTEDAQEGPRAFAEKRKPTFRGK